MGLPSLLSVLKDRTSLRRWREAERGLDLRDMADLLPAARRLRAQADAVARAGERRMSLRADSVARPPQADWAWRPDPWAVALPPHVWAGVEGGQALVPGVSVFHDCPLSEITLRQRRAQDTAKSAPHSLMVDVLGFEGSFLSLALDLPEAGWHDLGPGHIIGLKGQFAMEQLREVFARLNIRHGPNTETVVQELTPGERPDGVVEAEFDLGLLEVNPKKVTHAWLDVILDRPGMNVATIHDITLTRRPRADI